MNLHPQLFVKLVLDHQPRNVVEEGIDVAIRIGPLAESSLRMRKVGEVDRLIVATPKFWEEHGRPEHPSALGRLEWLIFDRTVRADRAIEAGELEEVLKDWRRVPRLSVFAVYTEARVVTEKLRRCVD